MVSKDKESREMSNRMITLAHDQSIESREAIAAILVRQAHEGIRFVDVTTGCNWDGRLGYRIPFVITPEGTFQGLGGVREYINRPDEFRR